MLDDEALIEEARQRARRHRRRGLAAVVLLCAAIFGVLLLIDHTSGSASMALRSLARPAAGRLPAGTIAVTQGSWSRTLLWSRVGLHDPGITGRAVAWSPDSRRLLIARSQILYVVHSNGAGRLRLPLGRRIQRGLVAGRNKDRVRRRPTRCGRAALRFAASTSSAPMVATSADSLVSRPRRKTPGRLAISPGRQTEHTCCLRDALSATPDAGSTSPGQMGEEFRTHS